MSEENYRRWPEWKNPSYLAQATNSLSQSSSSSYKGQSNRDYGHSSSHKRSHSYDNSYRSHPPAGDKNKKNKRQRRWQGEKKTFIPAMSIGFPSNMSKCQESAYLYVPLKEKFKSKPITITKSGGVNCYEITPGTGQEAVSGMTIDVYYEGRLKSNGKLFDNCISGTPFRFELCAGSVIIGWDVGILGMKVGGKRIILCPPKMAYGMMGVPPHIPRDAWVFYEVTLCCIVKESKKKEDTTLAEEEEIGRVKDEPEEEKELERVMYEPEELGRVKDEPEEEKELERVKYEPEELGRVMDDPKVIKAADTKMPRKKNKTFGGLGGVSGKDMVNGTGPKAVTGSTVGIYYKATVKSSGRVFDECTSGTPFKFQLGAGSVIAGWDVGIPGMQVGGQRKLTVPPKMAYGELGPLANMPRNTHNYNKHSMVVMIFYITLKSLTDDK